MAEEILRFAQQDILEAQKALEESHEMIQRLKAAGEDVTALEREYRTEKARLRRYKRAFEVED